MEAEKLVVSESQFELDERRLRYLLNSTPFVIYSTKQPVTSRARLSAITSKKCLVTASKR